MPSNLDRETLRAVLIKADSYLSLLWHRHTDPAIRADATLSMEIEATIAALRKAYEAAPPRPVAAQDEVSARECGREAGATPHLGRSLIPADGDVQNQERRDPAAAQTAGDNPRRIPAPHDDPRLPRYGIQWQGPTLPISVPMPDGYWTPHYLAEAEIACLRAERDEARQEEDRLKRRIQGMHLSREILLDKVASLKAEIARLRAERADLAAKLAGVCDDAERQSAEAERAALARAVQIVEQERETLAALCHKQWTGWMRYLFSRASVTRDGALLPPAWVERWQRQMDTPYARLSAREQDSDRKEADRNIAIVLAALRAAQEPST